MAKANKSKSVGQSFSGNVLKNQKAISKLEEEIKYDEEIVENIQKKPVLSQDDLDLIENFGKKIEKAREKLEALQEVNNKLKEGTDEYDSALRSIGSRYGEINDIYKESEKILASTKAEISGIISITGLLSASNKGIINSVLKSQKAYRGITTSIVENMGSLEDSEGAYKKIGIQIDEQKQLVQDIGKELDSIDKSDEKQIKAAEKLKKQLTEQSSSLDGMKNAAQGVENRLKGVTKAASVLGQTPVGSFINDMLAGVQQIGRAFGADLPGSIDDLLEGSKKSIAKGGLEKIKKLETKPEIPPPTQPEAVQQTAAPAQSQVPPPTQPQPIQSAESQMPQPSSIQNVTQNLEEKQTKVAEKSSNFLSRLVSAGNKSKTKRAELESKGIQQKEETVIPPPTETSIDNSKETSITNVTNNVGEAAEPTAQPDTKPIETGIESISQVVSQEMKTEGQEFTDKVKDSGTSATNSLLEGGSKIAEGATAAAEASAAAAGGGAATGALAMAGPIAAIVAGVFMLGSAIKDSIKYFDSLEDATDTLARKMTSISTTQGQRGAEKAAMESLGDLNAPIGELGSEELKKDVRGTKEFRQLAFDYTIGQAVKQRQELQTDYFNFEKQSYMDMVGYQQSLVTDQIDYEIGLQRDAMQFGFQQAMANLEAEGERRKTLAGSAMKFIGQYATVSERALNAIGSSTKAIMDGMKQFGAILGGTNKSQFELVENAQGLAYSYGASSEEVLNVSHMFKQLGKTTDKVGMRLTTGLREFVEASGGNVQSVFAEIAASSADIYRLMSATPEQIAKQTTALQKAGVKLSAMLKASDTMVLNYKDSIKAEMSLGAMLGRNVNFTEARAALMSGDMVGAANAIRQSLGGIDVNQLNPFQKQELTRATGMDLNQLIQLTQTGKIETDEEKQLKQAELTGNAIARGVLNQDIANQGARLALEQAQRKQLLEFEQRVRLLMLNVEQAKRLQMIPIEAAYRAKYAKDIQFPQEIDNMLLGVVKEGFTGTFNQLTAESFQQMGDQMMGAYGLTSNVPGLGATAIGGNAGVAPGGKATTPTAPAGVVQLQNTISSINKTIPSVVSMTDPKYVQYMMSQFKMGEEFHSKVSKKGMTDEQKSKVALEYEQKAKNLYETTFATEIQKINAQKIQEQSQRNTQIERDINIAKAISGQDKKGLSLHEYQKKYNVTDTEIEKVKKLLLESKYVSTSGGGMAGGGGGYYEYSFNAKKAEEYKKKMTGEVVTNPQVNVKAPAGDIVAPERNTTQPVTNIPSQTTPPPATNVPPPAQVTVNMADTNAILNKIQAEADQRGITMYTKQIQQNGNLQMIVTRTQNTAAAVEASKLDIKKVADVGVASTQNLEQIQIEMIKELQTANDLLVGVLNNTSPVDKGMVINLDGSKIASNFIGRMNNRKSFNNSNRTPTNI